MTDIYEKISENYRLHRDDAYIFEKHGDAFVPMTYGTFISEVSALADRLNSVGLNGKKIIVFGKNSADFMISDMAVFAFVGICVNISFGTRAGELKKIIDKVDADGIIYDERLENVVNEAAKNNRALVKLCMQDVIPKLDINNTAPLITERKSPGECVKIFFSSGTTADPKAVMLSLRNIMSGYEPLNKRVPFTVHDRLYLFLPLHHAYGNIYNFIYSFISGSQLYICSKVDSIPSELRQVNPTIFCGVPLIFRRVFEANPEGLKSAFGNAIKILSSAGSASDPAVRRVYRESGLTLLEAYAMTECSASVTLQFPDECGTDSCGRVYENVDLKILNPDKNGVGDIAISGDNVFLGYYSNEALTRASFNSDGYFLTGDCGYLKGGELYFTGRKKRVIIGENGENIYPADIEKDLLSLCADILSVKVFMGENGLVCEAVLKAGTDADFAAVIAEFNASAAKYNRIEQFRSITSENFTGIK